MSIQASQLIAKVATEGVETTKSQLRDVGGVVTSTGGMFKQALGGAISFASNMAGQALQFLGSQLVDSVKVAMAHQDVMAQTAQAIKSTGDASGMTTQSISDLADSLSRTTPFAEDLTEGGENMLLTFTGIGKSVFPQATQTMLDMAQAMHTGPTQEALLLGKALNDPTTGLTALTRVGVTFSDQEKEQIKVMMSHNDVAGAQKVMLKELSTEFGGSAVAAGKTFGGSLQILQNNLQDVKDKIGTALIPVLANLSGFVAEKVMPALHQFGDWFAVNVAPALQKFGAFVQADVIPALQNAAAWLAKFAGNPDVKAFLETLTKDFKTVSSDLQTNFLPTIQRLGGFFQTNVLPILQQVGGFLMTTFMPIWKQLQALWASEIVPLMQQLWGALQPALPAFKFLGEVIGGIVVVSFGILIGILKGVIQAFAGLLSGVVTIIGGIVQFITGLVQFVSGIVRFIYDLFTGNFSALGSDLGAIWQGIVNMFQGVWGVIVGVFQAAWGAISGFVSGLVTGVIGFFQHLFDELVGHSIIPDMIASIIGFFESLPGKVFGFIENLVSGGIKRFQDFWHGIVDGGKNILGTIGDAISGLFKNAINSAIINPVNWIINQLDKIHVSTPFGSVGISIPNIPLLAGGGFVTRAGMAIVGDDGPEGLILPQGARVIPHNQLSGMSASSGGSDGRPIYLVLNGQVVARGLMPHIANEARYQLGTRF